MASFPTITFSEVKHKVHNGYSNGAITYRDEDITPVFNHGTGSTYRASYNAPFNSITGKYRSNIALSRFEIRVNRVEDSDYGPGIGNLAHVDLGISANTLTSFTINITQATFTGSPTNTYRVCLMAQSSLDYSWDFTQLYMVVGSNNSSDIYKGKKNKTMKKWDILLFIYDFININLLIFI